MAKSSTRKSARSEIATSCQTEPIREAIGALLAHPEVRAKNKICCVCGSASHLLTARMCLLGTGESWEVPFPLCEGCAAEEKIILLQHELTH